ncbi:MAG: Asp-tRNA(Asn)/Glu-tRNA(Gln) amidotransferase subunit GatB [Thermoanaerobaculia bacterium]
MSWQPVIVLEIHARLLTATKIFCGCRTTFGAPPNTQVCPVCLGYPGALPVLNRKAVELGLRMATATGCEVHPTSIFARKNYFYPDLPKGYQISQFERPLATNGTLEIGGRTIRIRRIHLEEDAGKLIHQSDGTLVDLNRSGVPLIEIVSEPDITSAEEAAAYFTRVRQILMYTDVCDGNMEEGSLRCDANVSMHRQGEPLGTRAEIKNLNSFRFVAHAIEFEIERQIAVLEAGGSVDQETRLFDPSSGETRIMRSKEEAHDYRYFPDPDLLRVDVDAKWIEEVRRALPPLPNARLERYQKEFGIAALDADALVATKELADYFEETAREANSGRLAANWVRNEVLRILNERKLELRDYPVKQAMLGSLIRLVDSGAIGGKSAKEVFDEMSASGEDPQQIVERRGLSQISDATVIRDAALRVLEKNATQVDQYRGGKTQVFGFLVGQLMKETRGKAKAELANEVLRELLDGSVPTTRSTG